MERNVDPPRRSLQNNIPIDDDGRPRRTGTLLTASAHIITSVVGSGVLALPWAIAQLGWVIGPLALIIFSLITLYSSTLLADSYRSPDPISGRRSYNYMGVVKANLGSRDTILSGLAQYSNLIGVTIGCTIITSASMVAVKRSSCFHKHGHNAGCHISKNPSIITFGAIQMLLSQIPNIHELSWLSLLTTLMCFSHASIGLGLSIAKVAGGVHAETSITGALVENDISTSDKLWNAFTALGNLAFAYGFFEVLIEIQDTLRSFPPENMVMKQASFAGISISTLFYLLCGLLGYAAFGNNAPGNFLAGFGFYEPFWLVDLANICVIIHLMGAYQICSQSVFAFVEHWSRKKWPNARLINKEFYLYHINFSVFKITWRIIYVIFTTTVALMFPFFNDFVGLLGAMTIWPLTVYFPFKIHMRRKNVEKLSVQWFSLQIISIICFITSIAAIIGSIAGIVKSLNTFKIFSSVS